MRLRIFLLLFGIAILLPVVAFSAIALKMLENAELDAQLRGLHETARAASLLVDRELYSSEAALKVLASSPHLASGSMAVFYEQAKTANRGPGNWTILFDEMGRQVFNTVLPFDSVRSKPVEKARVDKVLEMNATLVSDVVTGPITRRLYATINIPVALPDGQRYILAQAFTTDYFGEILPAKNLPDSWVLGLIDKQGRFITRSLNRQQRIGTPARPELVEAASREHTGLIRHKTIEGTEVFDAFTHSDMSGWTIAVAAPVEKITYSARKAISVAAFGMALTLMCAVATALFLGGRLAHAIELAATAAKAIGSGLTPIPVRSNISEIRQLNTALSDAGHSLAQANHYRLQAETERQALLANEKKARQLAEDQNKSKDQFLAMLGHELRNPLAPLSTAAQLLKQPNLDNERAHRIGDIVDRQVKHMNQLVNDLLDVSRVTSGLVVLQCEDLDAREVVSLAVEQVQPLIDQNQHHLQIELPSSPAWVHADKTRLVQILANILSNAAKYTPNGGVLAIELLLEGMTVVINVKDNGVGIDEKLLPRVFDLFSQAERTPDRQQGGLGLGLALVRSLVEMHGGVVSARSAGIGLGSLFTIELRRLTEPASAKDSSEGTAVRLPLALRVTIVDDNADAANMLGELLEVEHGYQVTLHYSGKSAALHAALEQSDVFILDIGLPDMTGYDLAREIRSKPLNQTATIIAVTGYNQDSDRLLAKEAGFDHHMAKPVDPIQLIALFQEAIAKKPI